MESSRVGLHGSDLGTPQNGSKGLGDGGSGFADGSDGFVVCAYRRRTSKCDRDVESVRKLVSCTIPKT